MAKKPHCHKKDRCRDSLRNTVTISTDKYERLVNTKALFRAVHQFVSGIEHNIAYVDITPLRNLLDIHPRPSLWDEISKAASAAFDTSNHAAATEPQPERE